MAFQGEGTANGGEQICVGSIAILSVIVNIVDGIINIMDSFKYLQTYYFV